MSNCFDSIHSASINDLITGHKRNIQECIISHRCGISMKVLSIGGVITQLNVPDNAGTKRDIVLGYEDYDDYFNNTYFLGCVIGRYCNRISNGQFSMDGNNYKLDKNLGKHHLHGGNKGYHHRNWKMVTFINQEEVGVKLSLNSPDGDQGYPGELNVLITYTLTGIGSLRITYEAKTTKKTPIGLTQHTYFNLNGVHSRITNHNLEIYTKEILEVDNDLIPTGKFVKVNPILNFTQGKNIGQMLSNGKEMLEETKGYDHCYSFGQSTAEDFNHMAKLSSKDTGIVMNMYSTELGMQLYTGNHLSNIIGKNNRIYGQYDGLCLEAQPYPDSPNKSEFPSVILQPDKTYKSTTELVFSRDDLRV